ncbi:ribonuclease domain-containing protein [Nocardia vaccinii]|uniref:ribonuclease domain-containing protein n=1 Tax=Nocardia vaccinii TaxID=1822 RepID=UPI000A5C4A1E|nr:ribonuclease domain-containing protein [Nocardia vaccinii]
MTNDPISPDTPSPEKGWTRPLSMLAAATMATLVALSVLLGGLGTAHRTGTAPVAAQSATDPRPIACSIPDQARRTLSLIDAGQWPPNDGSGTKGGTTWSDREGNLPKTDGSGKTIRYQEWDVNRKVSGHNRDAERIVTGDDGSAWYTGDHYVTFCRMR